MASKITGDLITTALLTEYFPHKTIHDASDKPIEKILQILKWCEDFPDILVFIKRNSITEVYFEAIEQMEESKVKGIAGTASFVDKRPSTVVINRDNYTWFDQSCPNVIVAINQMINEENECIVCQEKETDMENLKCECTANLCKSCFHNLKGGKKCPGCRKDLIAHL
jgi:hypothetical protein